MTTLRPGDVFATFGQDDLPSIPPHIHGPVLQETLTAMSYGATGSKVPLEVLDNVKSQVTHVLGAILGVYERDVAAGEVGPRGTAVATRARKREEDDGPTGLLYGRVQSGKTNAMIVLTAMAIDNGFRIVIVLTSDNVSLVKQTANRFQVLQGVTVKDSTAIGSWLENPDHIKASLKQGGLVLVTAKNSSHMDTFIDFLEKVDAGGFPALILDDEADQATLDTNVKAATSAARKGKDAPTSGPSKIFSHHLTMRSVLRHHVYLQVTATPYALWLQNLNHPLRPKFTKLLEPGHGYTGGAFFFTKQVFDEGAPPLVFVEKNEDSQLVDEREDIPEGLEKAIGYFLVATAAQGLADPEQKYRQQNFLCHTSFKKSEHKTAADKIRKYVAKLRDALTTGGPIAETALRRGLQELERSTTAVPTFQETKLYLQWKLKNFDVFIINSEHDDLELPPKMNFIIGGNILGRGMTIDNLLVTYYLRSTKIAQMDTVLQHARMFGYRHKSKDLLRVFLPQMQALRFVKIQQAEDALRELQSETPTGRIIPVRATKDMKPTRTNVLDASRVVAYHPGEHLYPTLPLHGKGAEAKHVAALELVKRKFGISIAQKQDAPLTITIDDIIEVLPSLPYDEDECGNWDPVAIRSVLSDLKDLLGNRAFLHARKAKRSVLSEGMLGSKELAQLRALGYPVLCIFVDDHGKLDERKDDGRRVSLDLALYVFPEIVLPKTNETPVHVFNVS